WGSRARSPLARPLARRRHNGPGVHVHRVLGLVGQVRPPVLHLCDLRVGIRGTRPVVVGRLVLPPSIQPRQCFARRGLDPRGLRQPLQQLLVPPPPIPPHPTLPPPL